ncbi:MAG: hypothetical protein WA917_08225 [Comamonas sp.]
MKLHPLAAAAALLAFAGTAGAGTAISNLSATLVTANGAPVTYSNAALPIADTLVVSPQHVGHMLLVPYYSVQGGNASLLNLINTDRVNGKAVKVRYRGAAHGDTVYDFTVYLSPGDMWSANVSQMGASAHLSSNDASCTLPASVEGDFSAARAQGDVAQTREGSIEIINMADVPPRLALVPTTGIGNLGSLTDQANPLFDAITQKNGVPDCAALPDQRADINATFPVNDDHWAKRGYNFPTGGLVAHWTIVNLTKSGSFTGAATAIAARKSGSTSDRAVANLVFSAQTSDAQPLALDQHTHPVYLTSDPLLAGGIYPSGTVAAPVTQALKSDFPDLSTPYVLNPATRGSAMAQTEMLAAALATRSVSNEYMTSPVVSFATDWTLAMPTQRYSVARDGAGAAGKELVFGSTLDFNSNPPQLPSVGVFGDKYFTGSNVSLSADKSQLCVRTDAVSYFDTEHRDSGPVASPVPPDATLNLCGVVSVVTFNNAAGSVLGAQLTAQNFAPRQPGTSEVFTDGWMTVATPGNNGLIGLPVIGFAHAKALSSSANLGGTWAHSMDRDGL